MSFTIYFLQIIIWGVLIWLANNYTLYEANTQAYYYTDTGQMHIIGSFTDGLANCHFQLGMFSPEFPESYVLMCRLD